MPVVVVLTVVVVVDLGRHHRVHGTCVDLQIRASASAEEEVVGTTTLTLVRARRHRFLPREKIQEMTTERVHREEEVRG